MISRRGFMKTAAAAAPLILSSRVFGAEGAAPPSETVNVGLIGLGGRCQEIARTAFNIPGMRIVAVCDCFKPRVDDWMAKKPEDQQWTPYTDFREMIEKENLDGVMVETTTHARAWVSCHAMAMGMDAYIEKPMCLTIAEGREMVNCARKYERVTQVGTQQRSIPLNNWASDLVKNGAIGTIKTVIAPNFMGGLQWTPVEPPPRPEDPNMPYEMPAEFVMPDGGSEDWWDVWTNQAELRPYHRDIHYGWARWRDYDGGGVSFGVTGWGTHSYDQLQRGLGTDETGPVEVILAQPVRMKPAGVYPEREILPSETGAPYYQMVRNSSGPRADVIMKYANGVQLTLTLDGDWGPGLGAIFVGENGTIEINRDMISGTPEEIIQGPDRPPQLTVMETQPHIENWVECIKTRGRCTADIEYGQRSSTICYLVNIARDLGQVGVPLQWDPDAERFTNSDDANAFLSLPRREGYELPA